MKKLFIVFLLIFYGYSADLYADEISIDTLKLKAQKQLNSIKACPIAFNNDYKIANKIHQAIIESNNKLTAVGVILSNDDYFDDYISKDLYELIMGDFTNHMEDIFSYLFKLEINARMNKHPIDQKEAESFANVVLDTYLKCYNKLFLLEKKF